MQEQTLKKKLKRLKSRNAMVRKRAAKKLGSQRDERVVQPLLTMFRDSKKAVRAEAAWALGEIGDMRAVQPLLSLLKEEATSIQSLEELALSFAATLIDEQTQEHLQDEATAHLEMALLAGGNKNSQEALLKTKDYGYPIPIHPLLKVFRDRDVKKSAVVREYAAEALGKIGDTRAVQPLLAALKDEAVRIGFVAIMGGFSQMSAELSAFNAVRKAEVLALGMIGDKQAVDSLLAMSAEDPDADVRHAATEALNKIGKT